MRKFIQSRDVFCRKGDLSNYTLVVENQQGAVVEAETPEDQRSLMVAMALHQVGRASLKEVTPLLAPGKIWA
jgi:hypothetical protein